MIPNNEYLRLLTNNHKTYRFYWTFVWFVPYRVYSWWIQTQQCFLLNFIKQTFGGNTNVNNNIINPPFQTIIGTGLIINK
jgi:hypothetical protein